MSRHSPTSQETNNAYWLNALNLTFGTHHVRKLVIKYGSAEHAWSRTPTELAHAGLSEKTITGVLARKKQVDPEAEWERLQKHTIETITIDDPRYPPLLKNIHSSPLLLYCRGNAPALTQPSLAVVGTRAHSSYGTLVVERLIPPLARASLAIVSGLAQGIDARAHEATLQAGGVTVAVLGNGLDTVVPTSNRALANKILEKDGAIISEYPWGTPPLKQHFPARNRIIAGTALGTLVIESRLPGGSLITADHALAEAREVFAVPGPITGAASEGTNKLIQDGAHPVTNADDILEILSFDKDTTVTSIPVELSATEQRIVDALETEPLYIDAIIKHTNLTAAEASARLTALELKGIVKNIGAQTYQRLK